MLGFHILLPHNHPNATSSQFSSWPRVWDPFGTMCSLAMLRLLSLSKSDGLCAVPNSILILLVQRHLVSIFLLRTPLLLSL